MENVLPGETFMAIVENTLGQTVFHIAVPPVQPVSEGLSGAEISSILLGILLTAALVVIGVFVYLFRKRSKFQ